MEYFLFDHVPKTGGIYFRQVLEQLIGKTSRNFDCGPDFPITRRDIILKLDRLHLVAGHLRLDTVMAFKRLRPRRTLTLVRDPVDLIASTYKYWRFDVQKDLPHCNLAKTLSFGEFIRHPGLAMTIDNPMTRHFFGIWAEEKLAINPTSIAMAIKMSDTYDFIGVTERMPETIRAFVRQFFPQHAAEGLDASEIFRNASSGSLAIEPEDRDYILQSNRIDYAVYAHANTRLDDGLSSFIDIRASC